MATLFTAADAHIDAPADVVLAILRDFDGHHRRILPPAFSDFEVVHDRLDDGTMTQFKLTLGGRTTEGRTIARDTGPGVISEQVLGRDMVTEFRVEPEADGSRVSIATQWTTTAGFGGLLERFFAPGMLRKVYVQELELLAAYAPSVAGSPIGAGSGASLAVSSSR